MATLDSSNDTEIPILKRKTQSLILKIKFVLENIWFYRTQILSIDLHHMISTNV